MSGKLNDLTTQLVEKWQIIFACVVVLTSLGINEVRLSDLKANQAESRQETERLRISISNDHDRLTSLIAKVDSLNENVIWIRSQFEKNPIPR